VLAVLLFQQLDDNISGISESLFINSLIANFEGDAHLSENFEEIFRHSL
jgi:hypothetical protein